MEEIVVLSAFDGMSCCQQALERQNIKVGTYYASEIDKYAIQVTQKNYPNTVQLGSVVDVDVSKLKKIDLFAGGSPCQSFSFAGKRKGMSTKDSIEILTLDHYLELKEKGFEFEGQSYLFWEYMRVLTDIRKINPEVKFLLENVMMGEKWQKVLTQAIGINPIEINSALVSAQNRRRLYWTNIGAESDGLFGDLKCMIKQPKDKGILLKDVLESEVDEKYYLSERMLKNLKMNGSSVGVVGHSGTGGQKGEIYAIQNKVGSLCASDYKQAKQIVGLTEVRSEEAKKIRRETGTNPKRAKEIAERTDGKTGAILTCLTLDNAVKINQRIRRLMPVEYERLQTVKDGYTAHVSDTQRYKMLGNGWTVDVISEIFSYLK